MHIEIDWKNIVYYLEKEIAQLNIFLIFMWPGIIINVYNEPKLWMTLSSSSEYYLSKNWGIMVSR